MGMFDFLSMAGNYESRKIGRLEAEWGLVSTAYVNDADKPYETAVRHRDYNDGKIVIVEAYDTREEAATGHERWVATMTSDRLPDRLIDRGESGLSQLVDAFGDDNEWRIKNRITNNGN
jgi:hypothetical protein